jgi:methylenetetrahydrofolate dehydrogenase (NADP+)/methenyltetrahydrofolate cyclohydrolase
MSARVLRGTPVVQDREARIRARVRELAAHGVVPTLAIVDATGQEAAERFARAKTRVCERLGLSARTFRLPSSGRERELLETLASLSQDQEVHGILLESPLPEAYRRLEAVTRIPPAKDVEGLHPFNLGRLLSGTGEFVPATAAACRELLHHYGIPIAGRHAVVVGRSPVVGRPVALLLLAQDATVTICHSRTRDLAHHTRQADILVVAAGHPGLVKAGMVKPGAVVLDVGMSFTDQGTVLGDVEAEGILEVASAWTPPSGGIGPVTTILLLENVVRAAEKAAGT